MLKTVILSDNLFDPTSKEIVEVESVCEFLVSRFDKFPHTARIYHNQVSRDRDVTPTDPTDTAGIDRLEELTGVFYVVIYPGTPIEIALVVISIVSAVASYYLAQSQIPSAAQRNVQQTSPNNELSERTNKPRPRARIPDIYGTVRSTPDLLSAYSVYEDHQEVEYAYMCIGRGEYEVPIAEIKDETTPISEIDGTRLEVFDPDTSPNSGDEPQLRIGDEITEPLYIADRSNAINGQVLKADDIGFEGNEDIRFYVAVGSETVPAGSGICELKLVELPDGYASDWSDYFEIGDTVTLTNAIYDFADDSTVWATGEDYAFRDLVSEDGVYYSCLEAHTSGTFATDLAAGKWEVFPQTEVNLNGTYTVNSLTGDFFTDYNLGLDDPTDVTTDWQIVQKSPLGGKSGFTSATVTRGGGPQWVGPYQIAAPDLTSIVNNFVALNGLFIDTGSAQVKIDVRVEIEITPTDINGEEVGAAEYFEATVIGSSVFRSTRAVTLRTPYGNSICYRGYYKIRARRTTPKFTQAGSIVDEIKWRDVISMGNVEAEDFGNVTTVHSVTRATGGALVAKARKTNMLVTRKLPQRISGSDFTTELYSTNSAADIISAMALDPYIGNRSVNDVDFDNIYDTIDEISDYFGTTSAAEFCYTFDSDNLSFEEMISSVARSIFCTAYRFGSVLKLSFEKKTSDSVLLFNHRNKLPGSEKRSISFGNQNDNDGIEYEYVSPDDDSLTTIYLPNDQARNPRKVESIGVRNEIQANLQANRIWSKIQNQNTITEFEATQEADLLVLTDRILVADNTRSGTQDGEVISQDGLELTLSQPVVFADGETYTIFIQHTDGSVESLPTTTGSDQYKVILGSAPKAALSLDVANFARSTYQIVGDAETPRQAFLLTEKSTRDNFTSTLSAINYSDEYYSHDFDYKDEVVNEVWEANLPGEVSFTPGTCTILLFPSSFPLTVTINQTNPSATIRYSTVSMPTVITDGTEYTGPFTVNAGETVYAKAFTALGAGDGSSILYDVNRWNLDFEYSENSQYIPLM